MDQLGCCVVAEMSSKELGVGKEAQAVRGSQTPKPGWELRTTLEQVTPPSGTRQTVLKRNKCKVLWDPKIHLCNYGMQKAQPHSHTLKSSKN